MPFQISMGKFDFIIEIYNRWIPDKALVFISLLKCILTYKQKINKLESRTSS
jgi:hypothetical protein